MGSPTKETKKAKKKIPRGRRAARRPLLKNRFMDLIFSLQGKNIFEGGNKTLLIYLGSGRDQCHSPEPVSEDSEAQFEGLPSARTHRECGAVDELRLCFKRDHHSGSVVHVRLSCYAHVYQVVPVP